MTPAIWLTHTRPDVYPEPFAFKPERFLEDGPDTYSWIPFGGSVRRCIGATFAEFEMRVVLREVLTRCELHKADPLAERPAAATSPSRRKTAPRWSSPSAGRPASRSLPDKTFPKLFVYTSPAEALLERGTDVESWNDERLDELSGRMDNGFKEVRGEMREGFERLERTMSEGFAQTNERIDRLMLGLLVATLGMIGALIAALVAPVLY